MIKAKVSTDYKDIERIFAGGSIQKEILKVWSTEANAYVFEAWKVLELEGALPLTFNSNGEALIDYQIYGNTAQDGTPTPENPIMPTGCGERTENVMPSAPAETKTNNGITITCDGNGVYTLSGTALISANVVFRLKDFTIPISVGQGGQGTMSLFNTAPSGQLTMTFLNGNTSIDAWFINSRNRKSNTYSTMSGAVCNAIQFFVPSGNNCDCVIKPCFTNDSIYPATYIPYGYKLPILSNSTVTNIYLGEVQTTRRIKKLVLTGNETPNIANSKFESGTKVFSFRFDQIGMTDILNYGELMYRIQYPFFYSSHFKQKSNRGDFQEIRDGEIGANTVDESQYYYNRYVIFASNAYTTVNEFKAYLAAQYSAGTPVTIWYVLAKPKTTVVNEPLMKIGDYADTLSMEQAGVSIPTNKGTTVIDYEGEDHFITSDGYELVDKNQNGFLLSGSTDSVRPSKMYIKYKGR